MRKPIVFFAFTLLAAQVAAQIPKDRNISPPAPAEVRYEFIGVNNLLMWLSNNGDMSFNPSTNRGGLEWPAGSGKTLVYEDGIVWGGRVAGQLRVGGSTYRHGLQPGPLGPDGNPLRPAADERNRIYMARKLTAADFASMSDAERKRLIKDYAEWPVADGAPYTDRDGVQGYQPAWDRWLAEQSFADPALRKTDEPLMLGDEVLWFVSNDKDPSLTDNFYGTPPIGIELQTLVWAYRTPGALSNIVFTRYRLVNKGPSNLEDAYLSKWSDPDLGSANDDFVGIDTLLNLGFCYNGLESDGEYGIPPAIGYDLLQGPVVPSPGDTAKYDLRKLAGYRNLPLSSFVFYLGGSSVYMDPALGTGALQMYNNQQGLIWNGQPFIDPTTGNPVKFSLAGDPLTNSGWVDGNPAGSGDRRFLMSTGPFTLRRNEPQEIIVATIAGRGSNRLSSLAVVKEYDKTVNSLIESDFSTITVPVPKLEAALAPNRIILHWGDPAILEKVEQWSRAGYAFQGYNVWQMKSPSDPLTSARRLGTFDKADGVTTIFDDLIDETSGALDPEPVQFGRDTGIRRQLTRTADAFTGASLINNQPYYFALTAYGYNPSPLVSPHAVESAPAVIEVRPQFPNPGFRNDSAGMDSAILIRRIAGFGSGTPVAAVVDPFKLTGDTYRVTFTRLARQTRVLYDDDGDPTTPPISVDLPVYGWNLKNVNTGRALADTLTMFDGIDNAVDIDGYKIGMSGLPVWKAGSEISSVEWLGTNAPDGIFTAASSDYDWTLGSKFFGTALKPWEVTKTVEIRFSRTQKSKGYMYLRGGTPSYGYRGYFASPITVWDVTDTVRPKQLEYAFVENAGSPYQNNEWGPGLSSGGDREYLFVLDEPYSDTPDSFYTTLKPNADAGRMKILYNFWGTQNSSFPQSSPTGYRWKEGDKWVITADRPMTDSDIFEFTPKRWDYSDAVAKSDFNAINVFPNPYCGDNTQELNKYQRFVTFNHLPPDATIRIYTLGGTLVRTIQKFGSGGGNLPLANSQLAIWDLCTEAGLPVGSGMYIIRIDLPGLGAQKVLKLGVIREAQFLDRI